MIKLTLINDIHHRKSAKFLLTNYQKLVSSICRDDFACLSPSIALNRRMKIPNSRWPHGSSSGLHPRTNYVSVLHMLHTLQQTEFVTTCSVVENTFTFVSQRTGLHEHLKFIKCMFSCRSHRKVAPNVKSERVLLEGNHLKKLIGNTASIGIEHARNGTKNLRRRKIMHFRKPRESSSDSWSANSTFRNIALGVHFAFNFHQIYYEFHRGYFSAQGLIYHSPHCSQMWFTKCKANRNTRYLCPAMFPNDLSLLSSLALFTQIANLSKTSTIIHGCYVSHFYLNFETKRFYKCLTNMHAMALKLQS